MYIVTASGEGIVDFDRYARIFTADKGDAILVSVGGNGSEPPVTLGRYPSMQQAKNAIHEVLEHLSHNDCVMQMPEGMPEFVGKIHDSHVKRRGGS